MGGRELILVEIRTWSTVLPSAMGLAVSVTRVECRQEIQGQYSRGMRWIAKCSFDGTVVLFSVWD